MQPEAGEWVYFEPVDLFEHCEWRGKTYCDTSPLIAVTCQAPKKMTAPASVKHTSSADEGDAVHRVAERVTELSAIGSPSARHAREAGS